MRLTPHRPSPVVNRFILAREKKRKEENEREEGWRRGGRRKDPSVSFNYLLWGVGELVFPRLCVSMSTKCKIVRNRPFANCL